MISFTGSTEVGREIAGVAGRNLVPVTLELGGKSPNIVFADADLERAADTALFSFSINQGQLCSAGTRLLVERSVHDEMLQLLVQRAGGLRIGDPADPATQLGTLVTEHQLERVEHFVADGAECGATVLIGGERPSVAGLPNGLFYTPTIFTDVNPASTIAQQEIFGPVLVVMPFEDEERCVALANGVDYGLAAGIWTRDLDRMHRMARRLDAGVIWGNTMHQLSPAVPRIGWKNSGLGYEGGLEQALEMTKTKSVWIGRSETAPHF